jgi:hypothetical protein
MDRRTIIFITVSVLIIVLYQELVLKQLPPPPMESPVETASPAEPVSTSPSLEANTGAAQPQAAAPARRRRSKDATSRSRPISTPPSCRRSADGSRASR